MKANGTASPDLVLFTILAAQADACRRDAVSFTLREQHAATALRRHFFGRQITLRLRADVVNTLFARKLLPGAEWVEICERGAPVERLYVIEGELVSFARGETCDLPEHHRDGYWFILRDAKFDYCVPARHWTPVVMRSGTTEARQHEEPPLGSIDYVLPVESWIGYAESLRTRSHANV